MVLTTLFRFDVCKFSRKLCELCVLLVLTQFDIMDRFLTKKAKSSESTEIIDSDSDTENSDIDASTKKQTKRKFRSVWLSQYNWLKDNNGCSFCVACDKKLYNNVTYLKKHEKLSCHVQNVKRKKNQVQLESCINLEEKHLSQQVYHAELTLVMFLIHHNLPFLLMDYLPQLIKECCPDSKIAGALHIARTKATNVSGILGNRAKNKIIEQLKTCKFSLIVDETTDISTKKCLVLVVRYFDKLSKRISDQFLALIGVTKTDATTLYSTIKEFINNHGIPLDNIIGLATDGANVMASELNGLVGKFKNDKNLFYLKCSCHSLHLCSAYAFKKMPAQIEKICRNIYNFFSHSPKRIDEFKEFQEYCEVQPHKILGVSMTRWLSLESVINRIIEQWNPLQLYFIDSVLEVNGVKATEIATQMNDPEIKIYFFFLSFILKTINDLNKEFQSEKVRLPYLYSHLETNFKLIMSNFMKIEYINSLQSLQCVDLQNNQNYLPIQKVNIGSKGEQHLQKLKLPISKTIEIKKNILNFYVEFLQQLQKRFDFARDDLKFLSIITPYKVLSENQISIEPLLSQFSNLFDFDEDEIVRQWNKLRFSSIELKKEMDIVDFWEKVSLHKDGMGEHCFKDLTKFIQNLMTLPHSSAAAERKFSTLNLIKTKLRNKLCLEIINNIMLAKELCISQDSKYVWSAVKEKF